LRPGNIQDVELTLDKEVVDVNVFFPIFTRYFLAKGKSFQMMVADLLRHREVNQNGGAPLILRADVQRLREIAHKRMAFVKATYRSYRAMNTPQDKDNVDIICLHMKTCIKNYHTLLPQLDLIATQWGVEVEDTVSQDDVGSLRSETVRQKRTKVLDKQLRDQVRDTRRSQVDESELVRRGKGKSSGSSHSEELYRMMNQAREEVRKRRVTEAAMSKLEEDLRLARQKIKAKGPPAESTAVIHPPSVSDVQPTSSRRITHSDRDSTSSQMLDSAASTDVGMQLIQVLRDASVNISSYSGKETKVNEDYPDGHTQRTYYRSLSSPLDILPPDHGPVKEYYKVKDANKDKFEGDRLNYPIWRRRFIATVHAQRMLISDKALALSTALDKKNDILGPMVKGLHYDATTYAAIIGQLERH
jgi:hypothetical protein